jgi:hypothetical protein
MVWQSSDLRLSRFSRPPQDIRSVANAAQLRSEKDSKMNASLIISKEAIPAFRKRMGELIQQDVGE